MKTFTLYRYCRDNSRRCAGNNTGMGIRFIKTKRFSSDLIHISRPSVWWGRGH